MGAEPTASTRHRQNPCDTPSNCLDAFNVHAFTAGSLAHTTTTATPITTATASISAICASDGDVGYDSSGSKR